jgi:hypothetical protein|uniref:Uncharacterized protein n=1 Tax=Sipha flava TaxID=143950 RepID=A0A2S2QXG8_9HEMI
MAVETSVLQRHVLRPPFETPLRANFQRATRRIRCTWDEVYIVIINVVSGNAKNERMTDDVAYRRDVAARNAGRGEMKIRPPRIEPSPLNRPLRRDEQCCHCLRSTADRSGVGFGNGRPFKRSCTPTDASLSSAFAPPSYPDRRLPTFTPWRPCPPRVGTSNRGKSLSLIVLSLRILSYTRTLRTVNVDTCNCVSTNEIFFSSLIYDQRPIENILRPNVETMHFLYKNDFDKDIS